MVCGDGAARLVHRCDLRCALRVAVQCSFVQYSASPRQPSKCFRLDGVPNYGIKAVDEGYLNTTRVVSAWRYALRV